MADRNLVLQLLITAKNQASAALQGIKTGVSALGDAASRAMEPLRTFGGLLTAAIGIGGAKELQERTDAYIRLTNSLKIATTGEAEYQAALDAVAAIARRTNADIETTAQLYGKVAQSAADLGLSQQQVGQLTEVISKGMQLSGASAEAASGAILQLTQAFSGGVLRGEEFNSVMEASPELMRQLAAGLGVTIGELRGLAEQGALTSRAVSAALLSQRDAIDSAYGETTRTVAEAFTNLNNQLILYVGRLNESTGVTTAISSTLKLLADNLNIVAAAAGAGLAAALLRSTQALASYAKESIAARAAARDHAIAAAAQRAAALEAAQGNLAAAQAAVNRAIAEQRLAALMLEEAMGEQAVARARAASATAAQAATAATTRYIAAQEALTAAQAATTAGAGLAARAMAFLAGPGGLILLAVSAFAALLPMLSRNKTELDALTVSTDQYRDSLKGLNAAQLNATLQKLNEGIQEQEKVVRDAEAQVNKLRDGHRGLFEVLSDGRPLMVQLTEAEGKLADARQKLDQMQKNLTASTEALGNARQQEDQDLGRQLAQYAQTQTAMAKYGQQLDEIGKQQKTLTGAQQERIQAEIELARAAGNVQEVDRLTLALAQQRADAARQQAELDRAAAVAATLKLDAVQKEYDLIRQKQPKDEEALRIAKQDAELKTAQAASSQALVAQLQQQAKDTDALALTTKTLETRLEALRAETERGIANSAREAEVNQVRIQAAIALAKAKGDEAAAARLTADATRQEVESAQQRIEQLRVQQAEIDRHIQKLYAQANADNDYAAAERATIEALKDKSAAIGADIAQIESRLPLQQREADQAEVMAGIIGRLARVYAEQATEHARATAASERYYDTQLKEIDGAIRVAQAKGDEAQAADLLQQKQQLLIDQADALAAAKAQEAIDAQHAADVKRMEALADGELTQAEREQLAALQEMADAKAAAAQQSQNHAEAVRQETAAQRDAAEAAAKTAAETRRQAEAEQQHAQQVQQLAQAADAAYSLYSEAVQAALADTESLTASTQTLGNEFAKTAALVRTNVGGWTVGFDAASSKLDQQRSILMDYADQLEQAGDWMDRLAEKTEAGTVTMQDIAGATRAVDLELGYLDEQDLDQLRGAIGDANAKLRQMQDETQAAQDRLAELNAELLEAQGQDQKAKLLRQQLDYQQQLAEIEQQRADADAAHNLELLATLNQQKAALDEINRIKLANLKADADAAAAAASQERAAAAASSPDGRNSRAGAGKTYTLNLTLGRASLTTTTTADPKAFLDELESAQRRST